MIQDSRRVDDLESGGLVIRVADVQRLRGEGIRFDFYVSFADAVNEARFTDVRVAGQHKGFFVRIDAGESAQMLTNLF